VTDVIVLCYHAVSERWDADLSVTPSQFEAQIRSLLGRGYRGATFSEAVTERAAAPTVAVTFDDGFRSVVEHAFPILARYGVPGTMFVVTEFVGADAPLAWSGIDHWIESPSASELKPVSWDDLRQLAAAGWEIGSHTCTHPHLTQCDDIELTHELRESKQRCERDLGLACRSLAYPYGDVDPRVWRVAGQAGYASAAALPSGRWGEETLLAWPRVGVWHGESLRRFRLKVSPMFRTLQASPAWSAVAAARHLSRS
jgi:peptidoglycan/xylan/chitin deacetylase (PgdA/CDA1 family)